MAIEKEALTNTIESDLAKRNRNWDKVETHLADITPQAISSSFTRVVGTSGTIYARYIPYLNMVWLSFNIIGVAEDSTSSLTVITFDTEYAPIATVRDTVRSASKNNGLGLVSIADSGSIVVNMDSNQSVLRGSYTWFTV